LITRDTVGIIIEVYNDINGYLVKIFVGNDGMVLQGGEVFRLGVSLMEIGSDGQAWVYWL
jgi:hypothetical protein